MEYYYLYDYSKTWAQKIVFTQRTWPVPPDYSNADPYKDGLFFVDLIKLIEDKTESTVKCFLFKNGDEEKRELFVNSSEYEKAIMSIKEKDGVFPEEVVFEDKDKQETLIMCILDFGGPEWHYDSLAYTLFFKNSSWKNILITEGLKMNPGRYEVSVDERDYPLFFERWKRKVILAFRGFIKK